MEVSFIDGMEKPILSLVRPYFSFIMLVKVVSWCIPVNKGTGSTPIRGIPMIGVIKLTLNFPIYPYKYSMKTHQ